MAFPIDDEEQLALGQPAAPTAPITTQQGTQPVEDDRQRRIKEYLQDAQKRSQKAKQDLQDNTLTDTERQATAQRVGDRSATSAIFDAFNFTGKPNAFAGYANSANAAEQKGLADKDAKAAAAQTMGRQADTDLLANNNALNDLAQTDAKQAAFTRDDTFKAQEQGRTTADRNSEDDVNSPESNLARTLAKKMLPSGKFDSLSATDIKRALPNITKVYEIEQKKLDRGDARADRKMKEDALNAEKEVAFDTPYGKANTKEDAKVLKEAHESKKNFDAKIQEMIDLRQKHNGGALFAREDVARGKQLSKDLLLEYKNMAKLGVLSKSDEAIVNAIIPADPLQYSAAGLMGQDPISHQLKKFQEDSNRDFETKIRTRTRQGMQDYNSGAVDPTAAATLPAPKQGHSEDGYVFMGGDPQDKANWKKQ